MSTGGEIDVKIKSLVSLLSAVQAPQLWFGIDVSFRPCWSRAQLRQLNGPLSIPSTLQVGGSPEYKTQLLEVLRVQELLFAKTVRGILFWSRILLKTPGFQFPFWKALSNYGF